MKPRITRFRRMWRGFHPSFFTLPPQHGKKVRKNRKKMKDVKEKSIKFARIKHFNHNQKLTVEFIKPTKTLNLT